MENKLQIKTCPVTQTSEKCSTVLRNLIFFFKFGLCHEVGNYLGQETESRTSIKSSQELMGQVNLFKLTIFHCFPKAKSVPIYQQGYKQQPSGLLEKMGVEPMFLPPGRLSFDGLGKRQILTDSERMNLHRQQPTSTDAWIQVHLTK